MKPSSGLQLKAKVETGATPSTRKAGADDDPDKKES